MGLNPDNTYTANSVQGCKEHCRSGSSNSNCQHSRLWCATAVDGAGVVTAGEHCTDRCVESSNGTNQNKLPWTI